MEARRRSAGFILVRHIAWILVVLAGCSQASGPDGGDAQRVSPTIAVSDGSATGADADRSETSEADQLPVGADDANADSKPDQFPASEGERRSSLPIALSLYLVVDAENAASELSTDRTAERLAQIAADVGGIWAQADITFDPITIDEIEVPSEVIEAIALRRDTGPFFDQVGLSFDVPDPGLVNGFYVSAAGGVNGFTPLGSRVFFVVDDPTVYDERVSSHELGHIFGLRHDLEDPDQLMFSGTNGMGLTNQEQEVARYGAEGLLESAR